MSRGQIDRGRSHCSEGCIRPTEEGGPFSWPSAPAVSRSKAVWRHVIVDARRCRPRQTLNYRLWLRYDSFQQLSLGDAETSENVEAPK